MFFTTSGIFGPLFAQLASLGTAPGFVSLRWDHNIKTIEVSAPDSNLFNYHKRIIGKDATALPAGVFIPVGIDIFHENHGILLADGSLMFRLLLNIDHAPAVGIYFSNFNISSGSELYIYDWERTVQHGAFTSANNNTSGVFAVAPVKTNQVVIEYISRNRRSGFSDLVIGDILFLYFDHKLQPQTENFGNSGWCQVNVNCPEGSNWQNQKRGVVRILSRVGALAYYCSGSLINNTRNDFSPYIITADHCARNSVGHYATTQDLSQWVFHFNFDAEECENPLDAPLFQSMVGATLRANVGSETHYLGSDFYLVELFDAIPAHFIPFFNGWNRAQQPPLSGVTIHHPSGDIKKISTFLSPASVVTWPGGGANMHLRVLWDQTTSGHGVTEPGSSGAPLFDQNGLITGKLTGGGASCSNLFSPDYYGRFSASWEYGPTPDRQLRHWLDPDNTGNTILPGTFYDNIILADFRADTTVIPANGTVNFTDQSVGVVNSWYWEFPGGTPSYSTEQNPQGIRYHTTGEFSVILTVSSGISGDTLVKTNYIRVLPAIAGKLYSDHIVLLLGSHYNSELKWELYDLTGKMVVAETISISGLFSTVLRFGQLSSGLYLLRVTFKDGSTLRKKIIVKR